MRKKWWLVVVILICWQWRQQLHNSLKFLIFSKGDWLTFCNLCCSCVVQRWETNWAWMSAEKYCSVCTIHDLVHIFNINKITILDLCSHFQHQQDKLFFLLHQMFSYTDYLQEAKQVDHGHKEASHEQLWSSSPLHTLMQNWWISNNKEMQLLVPSAIH